MITIKVKWKEPGLHPFKQESQVDTMDEATEKVKQILDDIKDVAEWYKVDVK